MSPSLLLQQPFIQITLPILIGFVAVGVWQNKRIDDLRAYLREFRAEMNSRLDPFSPNTLHLTITKAVRMSKRGIRR
jgi:hypothetical protein